MSSKENLNLYEKKKKEKSRDMSDFKTEYRNFAHVESGPELKIQI